MSDDDLEFQISQFLDGTLPLPERVALEQRLAVDADARRLLEEYRRLNEYLSHDLPLPGVKWDRLAEHLSEAVAEADGPVVAGRIFPAVWVRRVAIAACLVLMVGVTVRHFKHQRIVAESNVSPTLVVIGPSVEEADGVVVQEIAVGPSAEFASHGDSYPASQNSVDRPGRAFIFSAPALNGS